MDKKNLSLAKQSDYSGLKRSRIVIVEPTVRLAGCLGAMGRSLITTPPTLDWTNDYPAVNLIVASRKK